MTLGYLHHITDIVMIYYYWDKMEFYRHPKKPIRFGNVHRWFYEITIALFSVLSLFYLSQAWEPLAVFHEHPIWFIGVSIFIFVHIEGIYQLIWKKYFEKCMLFIRALRNDTEGRYRDWDKWFKDLNFRTKIIEDARTRKKEREKTDASFLFFIEYHALHTFLT